MKIRSGFVSNSSSSSFIVTFKKVPKSKKELQEILFGNRKEYHDPYSTETFPTDTVAEIVWKDMKQKPATLDIVKETISYGHPIAPEWLNLEKIPNINDFMIDNECDGEKYEQAWKDYYAQFDFLIPTKAIKEKRCFIFEYSDHDGNLNAAMEYGDLFNNAESVLRISQH